MGVSDDASDLFLGNKAYSPVQQTKVVNALARMNGAVDRGHFIKCAMWARNASVAFFRSWQAELYGNSSTKAERIERFVPLSGNAAARLANNRILFCFPADHLACSQRDLGPGARTVSFRTAGGS